MPTKIINLVLYGLLMLFVTCKSDLPINYIGIRTYNSNSTLYLEKYSDALVSNKNNNIRFFVHSVVKNSENYSFLNHLTRIDYTPDFNHVKGTALPNADSSEMIAYNAFFVKDGLHLALALDKKGSGLPCPGSKLMERTRSFVLFDDDGIIKKKAELMDFMCSDLEIKSVKVLSDGQFVVLVLDKTYHTAYLFYLDQDFKYKYHITPAPVEYGVDNTLKDVLAAEHSFFLLINFNEGNNRYFKIEEYSYDGISRQRYKNLKTGQVGLKLLPASNGFKVLSRSLQDRKTTITSFDFAFNYSENELPDASITNGLEYIHIGNSTEEMENNFEHIFSNFVYNDQSYYFVVKVFASSKTNYPYDKIAFVKNMFVKTNNDFKLNLYTPIDEAAHNNFYSYQYLVFTGSDFVHISSPQMGGNQLNFIKLDKNGNLLN